METLNTLNERNFDLTRILINLRQSLYIYKIIGLNADQINSNRIGRSFFGYIQGLTIESLAVNICKLFEIEKENGYELNSIHGIIRFLKESQMPCRNFEPVETFILKYGQEMENGDVLEKLDLVLNEFRQRHDRDLRRFKAFRNQRVAHAQNIVVTINTDLPSPAVIKELLDFGISFYSSVQESYVSSGPIKHESETKVLISAKQVLEKIGITNVKTEYDA